MFVDMKRIAIVPLLVAFALASIPGYPASRCKAVSEVLRRGKSDGLVRYLETVKPSEPPVVQLIMPFKFLTSKTVSYAALAFRAEDVDERCITKKKAEAKTLSFLRIRVSKLNSTLVAWMTPASLSPDSVHNIVGYNVAVYRFNDFTEFLWTQFLQNYNDYRPIGCGIVRYADCSDEITSKVSSRIQSPVARPAWMRPSKPASLLQPVWSHIPADETSLKLESEDEPNLKSAEDDEPIPELGPADEPNLMLAPKNEPIPELGPADEPNLMLAPKNEPIPELGPADEPNLMLAPKKEPIPKPKPTDKPSSMVKSIASQNKLKSGGSSGPMRPKGNSLSDRLSAWASRAVNNVNSAISGISQLVRSEVKDISDRARAGMKRLTG